MTYSDCKMSQAQTSSYARLIGLYAGLCPPYPNGVVLGMTILASSLLPYSPLVIDATRSTPLAITPCLRLSNPREPRRDRAASPARPALRYHRDEPFTPLQAETPTLMTRTLVIMSDIEEKHTTKKYTFFSTLNNTLHSLLPD